MRQPFSHVLMLMGAIAAFIPILAVDYVLDAYVRDRETAAAKAKVTALASQVELQVTTAVAALRGVLTESPSLCTPTFVANAQSAIENSTNLKQMLVENADGVQYCSAIGNGVTSSPLSLPQSLPGSAETFTVVKLGELNMPALKITQVFGQTRHVSVFTPLMGQSRAGLQYELDSTSMMRLVLGDGTTILTVGDAEPFDRRGTTTEFVAAQAFAGEIPIKVEYAIPFAKARARYADLDFSFTTVACFMSGGFLLLALYYVRRSRGPVFDLERAIARGEIKPYYQPVINLRTGELMGCEVLCRWQKRNGEMVPPGDFIDYAETTGLAIPMTLSLMQQVKYDLSDLCQQIPDFKVSINLFEGHFRDVSIVEDVQVIFGGSNIAYKQLVFEITERHPLKNSNVATSVIAALHALGAKLALDDAGTGHSNLAYLGTLGVDVIKIDRVFVDMVKPGTTQVPVLDGLIAMSKDLNCEIVAEGVETEEQALYLRARGVVQAQGFIFAPALKISAFRDLALALHATRSQQTDDADLASAA